MLLVFFSYSTESQELIDAELAARVLQLINITDSGLHSQVKRKKDNLFNYELSTLVIILFPSNFVP